MGGGGRMTRPPAELGVGRLAREVCRESPLVISKYVVTLVNFSFINSPQIYVVVKNTLI